MPAVMNSIARINTDVSYLTAGKYPYWLKGMSIVLAANKGRNDRISISNSGSYSFPLRQFLVFEVPACQLIAFNLLHSRSDNYRCISHSKMSGKP